MNQAPHIAVLDDEIDITVLLANYLKGHGLRVTQLHRGADLAPLMDADPAQVVLLDLGLPGEDGFAVARRVQAKWHCGLIIVTGRSNVIDKVVGLEMGADDYVTKPFDLRELTARVKAVLRRLPIPTTTGAARSLPTAERLCFAGWRLDLGAHALLDPQNREVRLTGGEFDLLWTFTRHPGRVLTRDFLLAETRRREAAPFDRTIDVQVGRLRRKMEVDADDPQLIKSVRGAGYVFVPEVMRD